MIRRKNVCSVGLIGFGLGVLLTAILGKGVCLIFVGICSIMVGLLLLN